jgi:hypothetical protein
VPYLIVLVVAALVLVIWGLIELGRLCAEYPAESIFAGVAVTSIAASAIVARYRASHRPVSINPATRGTVITAAPVREAIAPSPADAPPKKAPVCDGPKCEVRLGDNPWRCGGEFPDGHSGSGSFCSQECMVAWQELMAARHARR